MRSRLPLFALAALLLAGAGTGAVPASPATRSFTLEAIAVACDREADGICLAYNGVMPGPTLEVALGDRVTITLVNHIAQSLAQFPESETTRRLATLPVSFHVHGTALSVTEDGLTSAMGSTFVDSYAPPNGSFSYHFTARYNGTWHYHDHVLGLDGNEGIARGLVGTLAVRAGGDIRPAGILDVHALDGGPLVRAPSGLVAGQSLEMVAVGLGDWEWSLELRAPDGSLVRAFDLGPGVSEHVVVAHTLRGSYTWRLTNVILGDEHEGSVVVG